MVSLDIKKDGYISGRQLESILGHLVSELAEPFEQVATRLEKQDAEIKRLRSELEAVRRLRFSAKGRKL